MKITCNRQELVNAVLNVQRATASKSTMPALEGILIEAKDDTLRLCGYNLELGITTHIKAQIEEEGKIVLNARLFSDIIRKLPEETIDINVDKKLIATIESGLSEFSINGISPLEYPELPQLTDTTNVQIPANVLKSMIKQTIFSIADNDAKPIHTGILFDIDEESIKLVAVDGYRLALRKESIKYTDKISFVIPGKTLQEIIKLLPDTENEAMLELSTRHIMLRIDDYLVTSRLLEGEFLDYNSAIPETHTTSAVANTEDFINSVERMSLLITDRLKSPLRCIFNEGEIKFSCTTPIGKANDEISAKIEGEPVEIGFNNKYLQDALKNTDSDEVKIELSGPLSPMKILPTQGDSFLFLVLPVRLKS